MLNTILNNYQYMTTPKYRRPLNTSQNEILQILYKFRFATTELILQYQELQSPFYTYKRLANLVEQEYITRNYNGTYKIHGKQANYYLLKKGIRTLLSDPDLNHKALKGMYRDSSVSEVFIEHCLDIFKIYNKFIDLYGKDLEFYTKSEISGDPEFNTPLPDGYITIKKQEYILEIIEPNLAYYQLRAKIQKHIKNSDSEIWKRLDYPTLLFVCPNSAIERRVRIIANKSFGNYDSVINLYTTTMKSILATRAKDDSIWSNIENELVGL